MENKQQNNKNKIFTVNDRSDRNVTSVNTDHHVLALWFYCCQKLLGFSAFQVWGVPDEGYSRNAP
jgi:hypothetical protein